MSKKKTKKKKQSAGAKSGERGFELGFVPRVMYANTSSFDLNRHMIDGRVVGCAYGYDRVDGYPTPLPSLTFVGVKSDELLAASKCLESWGCAEDGDGVDINIVLKSDGGYLIGMQPNWQRTVNRVLKDDALVDLLFTGATWIKTIDTTNPVLREWKEYLSSKIAPIRIGFATAKVVDGSPRFDTIEPVPGALNFIKFGVTIETEEEKPDHWFFDIVRKKKGKTGQPGRPETRIPEGVFAARARVIDSAFPISRVRVQRAHLKEQMSALANTDLAQSQVEQAAINLELSREWTGGSDHYVGVKNLEAEWWERVGRRVEVAGMHDFLAGIDPVIVLHQLTLDVEHTLRHHGATVSSKFQTNQKMFVRLGYAQA